MARRSPPRGRKGPPSRGAAASRRRVRSETAALLPGEKADLIARRIAELEESLERIQPPPPRRTPATVSKTLVKFVVGVFLLPMAWVLTEAFVGCLSLRELGGPFGFLASGMLLFLILFAVLPRPFLMLPYVFGHEVTHALWVKLFGGRVENRFHVGLSGGHVLTDRVNTWIALSPYFFPIYSVLTATLWGVLVLTAHLLGNAELIRTLGSLGGGFYLLIGLTLSFHLVFTILLISKGQPDLRYGGSFFSMTLIYCINLAIVTGLFLLTSRTVTPAAYGARLADATSGLIGMLGLLGSRTAVLLHEVTGTP